jgi:hypothetical protein
MEICKHTKWLCENTRRLEEFSGRWVAFFTDKNQVRSGDSLQNALSPFKAKRSRSAPFVFHVPAAGDARTSIHFAKKK